MLVTISDKKLAVDSDNDGVVNYYNADVVTASDYYPGGMQMPGRKFTQANSSYRYGFNGKEQDKETTGTSTYDYGFRIYNPALGRFLSVDPLTKKFPNLTPYQYAGNKPIWCIDLDGLEDLPYTEKNQYGEKQIYLISSEFSDAFSTFTNEHKTIPSNSRPITQNMSDKQIYRLAVARMTLPGQFIIAKDQYLDEKYFKAEQAVKYYYSNLATSTMVNSAEMRALTTDIHDKVTSALFSDDNTMSDAAVTMIDRRTSFWGGRNIASDAVMLFGSGVAGWTKNLASKGIASLKSLGIPKGFGIFADAAKFKTTASNLGEQLTMNSAMQGEGSAIMGAGTQKALGDPRLAGMNITKFEASQKFTDKLGNTVTSTVHYLKNNATGVSFDFKFVTNTY